MIDDDLVINTKRVRDVCKYGTVNMLPTMRVTGVLFKRFIRS